ncbi:hypothetical protein H2204_011687 [Knufia peltigerae]|uniref:Amidoligase enzyme n=1 Tax=Knufia peltigerae TaxID=1002370 RepID=A0AA38XTP5_9EURO|nr:hypothetical protein H2204_011687 [Knufia peltigerae]
MSDAPKTLPLTFGVEIEVLFAVNYDLMQIREPSTPLLTLLRRNRRPDPRDQLTDFDGEDDERILQAAGILRRRGLDFIVHQPHDYIPEGDSKAWPLFNNWGLTAEAAVIYPGHKVQVATWSNHRILDLEGWHFRGLELISPILDVPNPQASNGESESLSQVNKYLELITKRTAANSPYLFMGHPKTTSIHVHIGLRPSATGQVAIPLHVLRHLAWIILTFEDTITLLHHPERHGYSGTKSQSHARPNRSGYAARLGEVDSPHVCQPFDPVKALFQIFDLNMTNEDEALQELRRITCGTRSWSGESSYYRDFFVNFSNIVRSEGWRKKATVEFRQHHGTLDEKDIDEWIIFVTALVRAAERKAYQAATPEDTPMPELPGSLYGASVDDLPLLMEEMSKYANILNTPRRSLKLLFDLLDLGIERRQYWWARAVKFQSVLRASSRYQEDSHIRSLCTGLPCLRDCEGWGEGELDEPPWDMEEGDSSGDSSGLGMSTPRSSSSND